MEPTPILLVSMLQLREQLGIPGRTSARLRWGEPPALVEVESWYFSGSHSQHQEKQQGSLSFVPLQ